MACAPRASAPLVAAVTEATTASRFCFETPMASLSAERVFSTPFLKAVMEAVVNWSTVDFTASAAAAMDRLLGWVAAGRGVSATQFSHVALQQSTGFCAPQHGPAWDNRALAHHVQVNRDNFAVQLLYTLG